MTNSISHRVRFTYIGIAFVTYLLFKHVIGPYAGLNDVALTVGSYLVAIAVATGYLYVRLLPRIEKSSGEE